MELYSDIECEIFKKLRNNASTQELSSALEEFITYKPDYAGRFGSWSHNLCHVFEGYGRTSCIDMKQADSVLNRPDIFEVIERVVTLAVSLAIENHELECVGRIINSILRYNWDHIRPDGEAFVFKPAALSDPRLIELLHPNRQSTSDLDFCDYNIAIRLFCEAKDPAELMAKIKELKSDQRGALHRFINETFGIATPMRLSIHSALEGIFVDIDGTLIIRDTQLGERKLNAELHDVLRTCIENGIKVTVCTGNDPEVASKELAKLGAHQELTKVISKTELRGKVVRILIDDTPPAYQGFFANEYFEPGGLLKKDGYAGYVYALECLGIHNEKEGSAQLVVEKKQEEAAPPKVVDKKKNPLSEDGVALAPKIGLLPPKSRFNGFCEKHLPTFTRMVERDKRRLC